MNVGIYSTFTGYYVFASFRLKKSPYINTVDNTSSHNEIHPTFVEVEAMWLQKMAK